MCVCTRVCVVCGCACESERMREKVKMLNLCVITIVWCFFFFSSLMSCWTLSVSSPWCQIASGVCACLNRHETLEKSYVLGMEKSSYCKVYIQKQSLQKTEFAGHHICCLRVRMLFTRRTRALSGLRWEGLFFFLLLHLATLWCKWKKKVIWRRKQICRSSVWCCFFFVKWNVECHFTQTIHVSDLQSDWKRGALRPLVELKKKKKTLWKTFITSFTHHAKDYIFFFDKTCHWSF